MENSSCKNIKFQSISLLHNALNYLWNFSNVSSLDKSTILDLVFVFYDDYVKIFLQNNFFHVEYKFYNIETNLTHGTVLMVNSTIFRDIISKLKNEVELKFVIKEDKLHLITKDTECSIYYKVINDSKELDYFNLEYYTGTTFTIDYNDLKTIVEKNISCLSEVTSDVEYAKIIISCNNNSVVKFFSTDRKRVCCNTISLLTNPTNIITNTVECSLDINYISKMIKAFSNIKSKTVNLFLTNNILGWNFENTYGWFKSEKYINLDKFLNINECGTVLIKSQLFLDAIQKLEIVKSVTQLICSLTFKHNAIIYDMYEPNKGNITIKHTVESNLSEEFKAFFNINFLKNIGKFSGEDLEIILQNSMRSMLVRSNSILNSVKVETKFLTLPVLSSY